MSNGIVNIHGKDYKTVALRVQEFRESETYSECSLETDIVSRDDFVIMKATIKDTDGRVLATGYAEEVRGSTNINRTSALENCETSAIGRALAALGFGGENYASADEMSDAAIKQREAEILDYFAKMSKVARENWESITAIKNALAVEDYPLAVEAYYEMGEEVQKLLNLAPTKGGLWTTQERNTFKSDEWASARNEYFGNAS